MQPVSASLDLQLSIANGRGLGDVVAAPGALGIWKHDFDSGESVESTWVAVDDCLDVDLERVLHEDVMELSVDAASVFDVAFVRADRVVGTARVGTAAGHGLQTRFVSLPADVTGPGFDRVHLCPVNGTGEVPVGHLLFYMDS